MPPKRRTSTPSGTTRAQQQRSQSTLSFSKGANRVTKPSVSAQQSKISKKDPALLDLIPVEDEKHTEPTTAEAAIDEQVKAETRHEDGADPLASTESKTEEVLGGRAKESEAGALGGKANGWVDDEEARARKITDGQIKAYWRKKEQERKTPRVHQEGLTIGEKILREFDMTGQYGPCIGIARLKRWKRANLLGLKPPVEVLAVLLKGVDDGDKKMQRAHVDELMSSRYIET